MTQDQADVVTKLSPHPVADTVSKLTGILSAKGIRLFAVIDQSAEARRAGLSLRDTTLVIFGSPAAGTPVMAAAPLAALDLPLKVLVWDDDGRTKVSYYSPAALAAALWSMVANSFNPLPLSMLVRRATVSGTDALATGSQPWPTTRPRPSQASSPSPAPGRWPTPPRA